jgi:hypothetical protein
MVSKYPSDAVVTHLFSTFEIKQAWLYSEWSPECQFSRYIQPHFSDREVLSGRNEHPPVELIQSVFEHVRGRYILWQSPREEAKWKKAVVNALPLEWVERNVEVLYPSEQRFPVTELKGIVLWNDCQEGRSKRYQLYEGNHRISAWRASGAPLTLPAVIFIGKPKK